MATFDGPNAVFSAAVSEYVRKGYDRAKRLHLIADGAKWIENRADELAFPGQELSMVLDWYHATEHVKDFANETFGTGTEANTSWYETAKSHLHEGELDEFLGLLRKSVKASIPADGDKPNPKLDTALKYFEKRRKLLCYKWCRESGLPIGSGMVEGGVRFVGKDRLDCTGMRWGTPGASVRTNQRTQRFSKLKSAWLLAA